MRSLEGTLSPARNHASRRLVQAQKSTGKVTNLCDGQKVVAPPTPLTEQYVPILLIINIGRKNSGGYAAICMIASDLDRKRQKHAICFQYDNLWITSETRTTGHRSHDVYEQKGVNLKYPKSVRLFSIGCGGENSENCPKLCAEATISMIAKTVGSDAERAARDYVIEIMAHSVLALGKELGISHDVYDGTRFGLKRPLLIHRPPRRSSSLYVASSLAGDFRCPFRPGKNIDDDVRGWINGLKDSPPPGRPSRTI